MANNLTSQSNLIHRPTNFTSSTSTNTSSLPYPSLFQEPYVLRVIRLGFQTILLVGGVLGNILVCAVTSRKRVQTSTGNLLILHLAISDLGILLVCFPFVVIRTEFPYSWPFGRFICKTIYPFSDIFYGVEIGCITAIAFHRYRMLVHCTKVQMSLDKAKKIIFVIWFVSFIFIVVPLFFVMDLEVQPWRKDCRPHWPNRISLQLYSLLSMLVFYVVPLTVILITYVKIRAELSKNNKRHDSYRKASFRRNSGRKEVTRRVSQNRRAVQILTPIVLIFAFSMLPFTIFRVIAVFNLLRMDTFKYIRVIFNVCTVLLMANSSVNPIIYSVVNSEFRREFSTYLRCSAENCCTDTSEQLSTVHHSSSRSQKNGRDAAGPLLGRRSSSSSRKNSRGSSAGKNSGSSGKNTGSAGKNSESAGKNSKSSVRGSSASCQSTKSHQKTSTRKNSKADLEHTAQDIELQDSPYVIQFTCTHETGGF